MHDSSSSRRKRRSLRIGFSTGTAMNAAARAALRHLLSHGVPAAIAVRLPSHCFIPVKIHRLLMDGADAWASVIKDGGDDPDVTNRAEILVRLSLVPTPEESLSFSQDCNGSRANVCLIGGKGVGFVTKPGLPVPVGEPAINPVPRQMLSQNLAEELATCCYSDPSIGYRKDNLSAWEPPSKPFVFLSLAECSKAYPSGRLDSSWPDGVMQCAWDGGTKASGSFSDLTNTVDDRPCRVLLQSFMLEVEVQVANGKQLAEKTLNPRLGIVGGISILGTSGLVKPFSHEAYEETIRSALAVASSNGCREVILSTGGKSERFARQYLAARPPEAFVQVADFYAFSLSEARESGFNSIIHSIFFGKLVKMAQGHAYTHAHKVSMDLQGIADSARLKGYDEDFCSELQSANTARHALTMLLKRRALDVIRTLTEQALQHSKQITGDNLAVRILLFDYDGTLLMDIHR
jgi:cobalt-precorrin-5B (C1)-methyltransferase